MRGSGTELYLALFYVIATPVEVGALTTCSCYTYTKAGFPWQGSREKCQEAGGDLVSMETEEEWEFVKNDIQNRSTHAPSDTEWYIGLYRNQTNANWTWVSGKPLTIQRWQPRKPDSTKFALIARNYPEGTFGLFNSVNGNLYKAYICEETRTDNCLNCWIHSTTLPITVEMTSSSKPSEIHTTHLSPTEKDLTPVTSATFTWHGSTTPSPVKPSSKPETSSKPSVVLILAVVFGVLFVVVAVALGIILLKRYRRSRKSRTKEDAAEQKPKLNEQKSDSDNPYDNVKQEAAKLLGTPKEEEEAQTCAEISERNDTYATVDKTKKKKRENKEELYYAELGDLDNDTGSAEPEKHSPYTPTVYADVVGTVQAGSLNKPSEKPGEAVYANMS